MERRSRDPLPCTRPERVLRRTRGRRPPPVCWAVRTSRYRWPVRLRGPVRPATFRTLAWAALLTQIGIVVTGAAVRLTESGLGCTDWPGCTDDRFVPAWGFHHWVEFGNRLLTFVVTIAAMAAVTGARRRRPYRPALFRLSLGLVVGIVAQAAIGAVLVAYDLDPRLTNVHFLVSMLLIADAVVLLHVAAADGGLRRAATVGPASPPVPVPVVVRCLGLAVAVAVTVVVGTGTVVTGTGPHGGDARADRFGFELRHVARLHAVAMWVFVACLVGFALVVLGAGRSRPHAATAAGGPAPTDGRTEALTRLRPTVVGLLAVTAGQGVLGYLQYGLGVPAGLVALHVLGSTVVWSLAVALVLQLRSPSPVPLDGACPAGAAPTVPRADVRPASRPVLSER